MTAHPNADLFAMTSADTAAMRAVARRQVQARIGIYAAPQPAVEVAAQPEGQKERLLLRAMIDAAKAKRESVRAGSNQPPAIAAPRMGPAEVQARLMAAIGLPKTAVEIEAETELRASTVKANLRKMALAGKIEAKSQGRHPGGQNKPFLYARLGTFPRPHDFKARPPAPTKPELRHAVLEVLAKPHAPFQVADVLGIGRANARYQVARLAEAGLIRPAGIVDVPRTKGIQQWVRA